MTDFGWRLPCDAPVTSGWNLKRVDPVHPEHGIVPHFGWDFGAEIGAPVLAPFKGRVEHWWPVEPPVAGFVSPRPLNGNCLILVPDDMPGYEMLLLHLHDSHVVVGDQFAMGDNIAHTGNTGYTTGPHLHAELHYQGQPFNMALVYGGRLHV